MSILPVEARIFCVPVWLKFNSFQIPTLLSDIVKLDTSPGEILFTGVGINFSTCTIYSGEYNLSFALLIQVNIC